MGWDVLWLNEDDLEDPEETTIELQQQMNTIINDMRFENQSGVLSIFKSLPDSRNVFKYDLEETVAKAGLTHEASETVVYQGREVPRVVANIQNDR